MKGYAKMHQEQLARMRDGEGFIAALDQSGGSSPKALSLYGIAESAYSDASGRFTLDSMLTGSLALRVRKQYMEDLQGAADASGLVVDRVDPRFQPSSKTWASG